MTSRLIRGFMDGALSSLGIVVGASAASSWIIVSAAVGGAVANGLSNFVGALAAAGSEEYEELRRIEKAMVVADLGKSELFQAAGKRAVLAGGVDALATMAGGTIAIVPYLFAPVLTAMLISVSLVTCSVFVIGIYLGKLSKKNLLVAGFKMAAFALFMSAVVYLLQKLIVPAGFAV